jgi:hypothetical protein
MADNDTVCPICQQLLQESTQITALEECEHKFCSECIVRTFRATNDKRCPVCRHIPDYLTKSSSGMMFTFDSSDDTESEDYSECLVTRRRSLLRHIYSADTRATRRLRAAKTRLREAERTMRATRREIMLNPAYRKARTRYATVRRQVISAECAALASVDPDNEWPEIVQEEYPRWYDQCGWNYDMNPMITDLMEMGYQ